MKQQGYKDVLEYAFATFLGACGVLLVNWFGKKYLEVDGKEVTETHIHLHHGNFSDDEDEEIPIEEVGEG